MCHPPTVVSLADFARTGRLGTITLGTSRDEVRWLFGKPTDWRAQTQIEQSDIWKYGDVEVHFDSRDCICLIHFDGFDVPRGCETLELTPWVIRRGLQLADLEAALNLAEIGFTSQSDPYNPGCVKLTTSGQVDLVVQTTGDANELGLFVFGRGGLTGVD